MSTLVSSETQLGLLPSEAHPRFAWIVQSLCARLGAGFDADAVAAEVHAAFVSFSAARVTDFIPILVERRVWDRLSPFRSIDDRGEERHDGSRTSGS